VEYEVGKGDADGDGGAQNEIEWRKSSPGSADEDCAVHIQLSSPFMLGSTERGEWKRVWNEIEALLFEVEEGIEEHPILRRSTHRKGSKEH